MFALAILIGIYSYLIFLLGILGLLYPFSIVLVSVMFFVLALFYLKRKEDIDLSFKPSRKNIPLFLLLFVMAIVNLVGTLGPELGFDALWYHLTLPKLFLQSHQIYFIPGGVHYYSLMPKLTELLYLPALLTGNEVFAKLIHFSFGILTLVVIYKLSRKLLDEKLSMLAAVIFYGSLVVAWESTTAYIDLARTFFELMAFWGFINFWETKDKKWLLESGVMMGFAISSKLTAISSLFIYASLFFVVLENKKEAAKNILTYCLIAILVSSPWFVFSFLQSGNPIYPLFTSFYPSNFSFEILNPFKIIGDLLTLFLKADDPISPIFLIIAPLVALSFKKMDAKTKLLTFYSLLALVVWYLTPRTGGGRFILPYLPVFSILTAVIISHLENIKIKKAAILIIVLIAITTVVYRGIANSKYIPVILGLESKDKFLTKHLNYSYGDFYDTDGFFKKHISKEDKILLFGFHNLYYVNFPFIDSSYVKKGEEFNYIAVKDGFLPKRFSFWELIYTNPTTNVRVYSLGGAPWHY